MYYVLRCLDYDDGADGYMEIEDWLDISGFSDWGMGRIAASRPIASIVINAVPHDGYKGLPKEFSDGAIPLMSARLKGVLDAAAVDNIVYYPVQLKNSETGATYDYFAFNLLGLVSATDFGKSRLESYDGDFKGDSTIEHLVVDPAKARDLAMFRLTEKFSTILVHERVRKRIEGAGINTLTFVRPEDYFHL